MGRGVVMLVWADGGLLCVLVSGVRPGMVVSTGGLACEVMFQSRSAGSIQGWRLPPGVKAVSKVPELMSGSISFEANVLSTKSFGWPCHWLSNDGSSLCG